MISFRHSFALLLALGLSAGAVRGQSPDRINFEVATMEDSSGEGPERQRPYVTVGKEKLCFAQPTKAQLLSNPEQLTLSLANRGISAEIIFTNSDYKPAQDLVSNIEIYHQAALSTLPAEISPDTLEFLGANSERYRMNEFRALSFEWIYTLFAHRTRRQVTYLNLNSKLQIRMVILAEAEQWEKAQAVASRFLTSLYFTESDGKRYLK